MSAWLNEPAILARIHPFRVETYHRLGEIGGTGECTELLGGFIIDQRPKSPLHASIVELLREHL